MKNVYTKNEREDEMYYLGYEDAMKSIGSNKWLEVPEGVYEYAPEKPKKAVDPCKKCKEELLDDIERKEEELHEEINKREKALAKREAQLKKTQEELKAEQEKLDTDRKRIEAERRMLNEEIFDESDIGSVL